MKAVVIYHSYVHFWCPVPLWKDRIKASTLCA